MKEEVNNAAEALLMLSKNIEKQAKRKANKVKRDAQPHTIRRSSRIASIEMEKIREKCWGCREDQPNQMAHVGPGGCIGEDY